MMKGLHEMKKARQALLRYLNMDLVSVIESFKGFVSEESVTVPYQQNLDYILIRMQGLSKLFIRVVGCTKRSATFFLGLIKAGSFYSKGVIFLSTLAKVWSLSREFCKAVVDQYNQLREFRERLLPKPGLKWVDGAYELPESLEVWLGDEYTSLIINQTYDVRLLIKEIDIKDYLEHKDENIMDPFNKIKVDECDSSEKMEQKVQQLINLKNELELEDFAPIPRTAKEIPPVVKTVEHSKSSISSKESVNSFITNETLYRKVDPLKSLTISKMKKKVWKEFKDDIKRKAILMQDDAFLDYVRDYLDEYKV